MITLHHRAQSQLDPHAVRALDLVKWEPRPDMPGNIWLAETAFGFLEVVHRPAKDDQQQTGWVGRIDGVDIIEGDSPRVTMDLLARHLAQIAGGHEPPAI